MHNFRRWLLILLTGGLVVVLLVSFLTIMPVLAQGPGGMMRGFGFNNGQSGGYGPGWMTLAPALPGGRSAGVGYTQGYTGTTPYGFGPGWMHRGFGPGSMMGGYGPRWGYTQGDDDAGAYGYGCPGMRGGGMWGSNSPFFDTEPLSLDEATVAVNSFLINLNDDNLALGEVMIFDNHAYAEIMEKDSGIGAMEVLIDPASKAVYPEMGPNMMWNLKYGMRAGYGSYGTRGRFGWPGNTTPGAGETPTEMPVSPTEAVEAAQTYLTNYVGDNLEAEEHAEPFYGYYTLHVNREGETIGMLSVNGFTGDVFLHTWHGNLVAMSGE